MNTIHSIVPPPLRLGDIIGIVSPSGKLPEPNALEQGIHLLQLWGLKPLLGQSVWKEAGYFAGTDAERRADLQSMINNPHVRAIICARGGYGMSRLIEGLNLSPLKESPKWILGFSDITALHLALQAEGICSLHAPNVSSLKPGPASDRLKAMLFGQSLPLQAPFMPENRLGTGIGPLVGGNLCVLMHQMGTPQQPDFEGKILFLEEVGEAPYRLDRSFNQLQRAGVFEQIAGLMIGDMDVQADLLKKFGATVPEMILEKLGNTRYPVAFGWPFGHIAQNHAVIYGEVGCLQVAGEGSWWGTKANQSA